MSYSIRYYIINNESYGDSINLSDVKMKKDTIAVGNLKIKVHPHDEYISNQLREHGYYEEDFIQLIQKHIKKGDLVVDIGANIGLHTVHFSKAVGESGSVIAFEPDPMNFILLRENIKLNNCTNVEAHNIALGNSNETRNLYRCNRNKGKQSFADLDKLNDPIRVEVRTAKDYLSDTPALVKLDVEGAEPFVIEGLGDIRPHSIFIEFIPWQLKALDNDPEKFLHDLVEKGYELYFIHRGGILPVEPISFTKFAEQTNGEYNILAEMVN